MNLLSTLTNPSLNGVKTPKLRLTRLIPESLRHGAVEDAVMAFMSENDVQGSKRGFFQQTIQAIAAATFLNTNGSKDFWVAEEEGEVMGYVLASVNVDIDNSLCYWIHQAWVHKKYRGHLVVKESLKTIKEHAKKLMCSHLIAIGNRKPQAYCRFLGQKTEIYAHLLKMDLGG